MRTTLCIILVVLMGIGVVLAEQRPARTPPYPTVGNNAPVNRRLKLQRTETGYILTGFRAGPVGENRFQLSAGMKAADARKQIDSLYWDVLEDRTADPTPTIKVMRKRRAGTTETITLTLDKPDGRVTSLRYEVHGARFSKSGLDRFLRAGYGQPGRADDDGKQLRRAYAKAGGTLTVDAQRSTNRKTAWNLSYTITAASKATPRHSTKPRSVGEKKGGRLLRGLLSHGDRVPAAATTPQTQPSNDQ